MTKVRTYELKRKRFWKIFASVFIVLLLVGGFFIYPNFNQKMAITEDELSFYEDRKSEIPTFDFIGFNNYINSEKSQVLDFITTPSALAFQYTKLYDASGTFLKPKGMNVVMGAQCNNGDYIRYMICSGTSKSTCTQDMFANLWQVAYAGNYLESSKYYINDLEFRWSYTCYKAIVTAVPTELYLYLDGNKCVQKAQASTSAIKYTTESACTTALKELLAKQQAQLDLQKQIEAERVVCTNNGGTFKESTRSCAMPQVTIQPTLPSSNTQTTTTPTTTTNTNVSTTTTTPSSNNQTTTTQTEEEIKLNCKAYENVENSKCSFSTSKLFSDQGLKEFYTENPLAIIFAVIIVIGGIFLVVRK